jgi:tryptophan synthase alpha subunit
VKLLAPVADGLIVGSAIVRKLAEHANPKDGIAAVSVLAEQLIEAMNG